MIAPPWNRLSPIVLSHSSCLTRGGKNRDAINNPFPYAFVTRWQSLRDITSRCVCFFPALGITDRVRFHFTAAAKTIRQKKGGRKRSGGKGSHESDRFAGTNDECAFIGLHLSRIVLACASEVPRQSCWWGYPWGWGWWWWWRKKYGSTGGWEMEGGNGQERERISGKIIGKFEYDSPRGFDPVEDIPEILQASFVRGFLSLFSLSSSISLFFSLSFFLYPFLAFSQLFPPSFAVGLSRAVSILLYLSSLRLTSSGVNLISGHHMLYRFAFWKALIYLKLYDRNWKLYIWHFASTFANNFLRFLFEILISIMIF